MPTPVLKSLATKAGVSMSKAEDMWDAAKKEAKQMGQEDNYAYITGIVKTMMGLDEADLRQTNKRIAKLFLKSKFKNFDEFIEAVLKDEVISTNFNDVPEHNLTNVPAKPYNHQYVDQIKAIMRDDPDEEDEKEK